MSLVTGARLGAYEIIAPLGSGGMGDVYKARDARLDRTVAIKVLPASLAADPQFKERFDREAKAISALDHPNICALYDVGEQDGMSYLVLQYLEGETLEARLKKGQLPLDQALQYGIQITAALDQAHRSGIVHRDLKPGNIMLTKSGAKLLDFGLAKAAVPAGMSPGSSMLATTPPNLTAQGSILGTFQYMAPEQLEGQDADARSDIWALGVVLHEMLTGKRAFDGKSQASLIAAIMHVDPAPLTKLQPLAPPALDRLVRTCLAKDPENRWQSGADLKRELQWIAESGTNLQPTESRASVPGRKSITAVVAAIVSGALIGAAIVSFLRRPAAPSPKPITRFAIELGTGEQFTGTRQLVAISRDGTRIAYVANQRIYLRSLNQLAATPLRGAEGATVSTPFFSPDGQWVGYADGLQLKKISINGGTPVTLGGEAARGVWGAASWEADDSIVFGTVGGVWRVRAAGGSSEPIIKLDAQQVAASPVFLPGNHAVLYAIPGSGVFAQRFDGSERRIVVDRAADARYLPTGHLAYVVDDTLWAVRFDPVALTVSGTPVPLVENVRRGLVAGASAQFSVSPTGSLVYVPGGLSEPRVLVWIDKQGRESPALGEPRPYEYVNLAPDGTRVALSTRGGASDIWIWELTRPSATRVTFESQGDHGNPIWSPDGRMIIFSWAAGTPPNIFRMAADGTGMAERLTNITANQSPEAVTPDGKTLVFREVDPRNGPDLHLLSLEGDHASKSLIATRFNELNADISPDGRWLAYQSNESGRFEIYVRPFPAVDTGRWQISNGGGTRPVWRAKGHELFFVAGDGRHMMTTAVTRTEPTFSAGTPTALFEATFLTAYPRSWDVAPDGRFLVIKPLSNEPARINVVENWFEELKQRVPAE
jgi:serine/threonine-protein kinase